MYEDALEANEKGDKVAFLQKYNTVLKCDLFKGSNTRFALLRDSEITKLLQNIQSQIKMISEDINKSNQLILQKLSSIQDVQNQQTGYIQEINKIVKYQSQSLEKIEKPFMWDDNESVWENFMRIGEPALELAISSADVIKQLGSAKIPFLPLVP
ncbi:hypothetical protein [Brasilonema sp. UFV-L1]|uniref:hypothetical protein n=1 Tax=Brasilonema sp. UFV-L1 TaxID=2234130 RepID=UPI00145DF015|nr:hypothetical protein [Brasilonema sp. UFV-L1]NMG11947.1 hypothetical protein [Brasilonema sp. UFV-L1]